jgi:23S rRNA (guanine745-N1)-methyltransferase
VHDGAEEQRVLRDVIEFLICPHCGGDMALVGTSVRCPNDHAFDVARHGYVSLLPGGAHTGTADTPAMVRARRTFLDAGHYAPIAREVAEEAERFGPRSAGCIVDLGAGTGYYLAAVLERLPHRSGLALDISKYALRRAARAHPRAGAVACDVWRALPVRTGAASVVLNVFAPRNGAEIKRILHPEGTLIVAAPTAGHLGELVSALKLLTVDEDKEQRLDEALVRHFEPDRHSTSEFSMSLRHEDVEALVMMGPSAWHVDPTSLRASIYTLPDPMPVTASVTVTAYRPR